MDENYGYGQQSPSDSADGYNATAFLVRQLINQMETSKLVKVAAVHSNGDVAGTGTVDVVPLVNQIDGANQATPHGTVYGLPWTRLQGGANAVICDPMVGDVGMVVVSDRDISNVKKTGAQSNPGSFRKFDLSDAVYVGCSLSATPTQYLVFTATGLRLVDVNGNSVAMSASGMTLTDKTGNVVTLSATGISLSPEGALPVTVNGPLVVNGGIQLSGAIESVTGGTYAGDIKTAGNVVAGFGTGGSVGLKTHTHTQPNDSHGDVEGPTSAPTAGT